MLLYRVAERPTTGFDNAAVVSYSAIGPGRSGLAREPAREVFAGHSRGSGRPSAVIGPLLGPAGVRTLRSRDDAATISRGDPSWHDRLCALECVPGRGGTGVIP